MTRGNTLLAGLIAAGTLAALAIADEPHTLSGYAAAVDGDTLRLGEARVRLFGIDAPERGQPGGVGATRALQAMLLADPHVACEVQGRDQYQRLVAICKNGGGDLGGRMVATGWAHAYRAYSMRYQDHEEAARAEGLGIWRGEAMEPAIWRKGKER